MLMAVAYAVGSPVLVAIIVWLLLAEVRDHRVLRDRLRRLQDERSGRTDDDQDAPW